MDVIINGERPADLGSEAYFSGRVWVSGMFAATEPARVSGASVTFEPGARTAWHVHPYGQTLIVTAGLGWVQKEGQPRQDIRPGDIVQILPGERHWHGATETTQMTHIAIQEAKDGQVVTWMDHVTDEDYRAADAQ